MPIQHTNDRVLQTMNRRLTKKKLFNLVENLRREIPEIVFRTSIIVGFPGETEEEFQELCDDLEQLQLDHVGVFRYSREEGTPAALMEGQIHPATKRARAKHLIKLLQSQSLKRNERFVGRTVVALIEGVSEESDLFYQARMSTQAQEIDGRILINDINPVVGRLGTGDLVSIQISEALPHDLVGKVTGLISRSKKYDESTSLGDYTSGTIQVHSSSHFA